MVDDNDNEKVGSKLDPTASRSEEIGRFSPKNDPTDNRKELRQNSKVKSRIGLGSHYVFFVVTCSLTVYLIFPSLSIDGNARFFSFLVTIVIASLLFTFERTWFGSSKCELNGKSFFHLKVHYGRISALLLVGAYIIIVVTVWFLGGGISFELFSWKK